MNFPDDHRDSYLDRMWGDYGFRRGGSTAAGIAQDLARDIVTAHHMVESFVNAFARDGHYAVTLRKDIQTAGTDMNTRHVYVTPAPIADLDLTAEQAGRVLTGLACHEISHPRYGKQTSHAVGMAFKANPVAQRLSNLLDDIRIERRFVEDYPGYADVFEPTLRYVGEASVKRNGGKKPVQRVDQPVNLAIAATRYPDFSEWDAVTSAEAAWWTDWADRWSSEDEPERHVAAIREALVRIASQQPEEPPQGAGSGQDGGSPDQDKDAGQGGAGGSMSDEELSARTRDADNSEMESEPSCSGSETVEDAARAGDLSTTQLRNVKREAQNVVDSEKNIEQDGHYGEIDVAQSLRGIVPAGAKPLKGSDIAQRYIRNAILRSRTGNTAVDSYQKRGRLDQKGIARIALGDTRIFERRTAPSPGKYNVWVMVDASSSMESRMPAAAQVAHAMATASSGVPSVRMTVWAWSYPFRLSNASVGVARVWETGQPADDIFLMTGLNKAGTPDAQITSWSARAIRKATRHDETPVLIIVSDGEGDMGAEEMNARVAEARSMGITVKSVSFGSGFSQAMQEARYGRGNCVPYAGSVIATAKPLAELFARITSGR